MTESEPHPRPPPHAPTAFFTQSFCKNSVQYQRLLVQYQLYREPPIFKPIDRRQGRERLESLCLSSCEQDSGIGSHGATWAPANLGEQRTSGSVSTRARSPCAHEAASGAASGASSGNHAHGGRTSAEAGGGLDADGLPLECSSPTSGRVGCVLRGCRSPVSGRAGGVRRRARYSGARLAAACHRATCCIHCSISPSSRDA